MGVITNLAGIGATESQLLIGSIGTLGNPHMRQCVSTGPVNTSLANRPPSLLSFTGPTVYANWGTTTAPTIVTMANGRHFPGASGNSPCYGPLDLTFALNGGPSGITLSSNIQAYIYLDRLNTSNSLTLGYTQLAPIYSRAQPSSPTIDQNWFDLVNYQMKRYNGSSWDIKQRVFLGEAKTDGTGNVTSVTTYAYNGRSETDWTTITAGSNIAFTHNLGSDVVSMACSPIVFGRTNSSDSLPQVAQGYVNSGSGYYGLLANPASISVARTSYGLVAGNLGVYFNGSAWLTTADLKAVFIRGW